MGIGYLCLLSAPTQPQDAGMPVDRRRVSSRIDGPVFEADAYRGCLWARNPLAEEYILGKDRDTISVRDPETRRQLEFKVDAARMQLQVANSVTGVYIRENDRSLLKAEKNEVN